MSRDAKDLYQETILEHGHHPRRNGPLAGATHEATLDNPLCGDRVTIRFRLENGHIYDARFEARGCLIATAGASLLCEAIVEKDETEAGALCVAVIALEDENEPGALGPLEVLAGARAFPARIGCATLAAKAASLALSDFGAKR